MKIDDVRINHIYKMLKGAQPGIPDLAEIRAGAALGATSLQHTDIVTDLSEATTNNKVVGALLFNNNKDKNFVFEQGVPNATWLIDHNLNKNPSVTIVDTAGNVQVPDEVSYVSLSRIEVKFLSAFAGKAYLN